MPGCTDDALTGYAKLFVRVGGPWDSGRVSIDMVKQFLMQHISSFRAAEMSENIAGPGTPLIAPAMMQDSFFEYLCQAGPALKHLESYPCVDNHVHE